MIRKLAHINFVTNNLEKIIDFYVNKLGMNVKFTLKTRKASPLDIILPAATQPSLSFSTRKWQPKCGVEP